MRRITHLNHETAKQPRRETAKTPDWRSRASLSVCGRSITELSRSVAQTSAKTDCTTPIEDRWPESKYQFVCVCVCVMRQPSPLPPSTHTQLCNARPAPSANQEGYTKEGRGVGGLMCSWIAVCGWRHCFMIAWRQHWRVGVSNVASVCRLMCLWGFVISKQEHVSIK